MNISLFLELLMICSLVTGLVVEAIKKMLEGKEKEFVSNNILAAIVAVIVAGGVFVGYVILYHVSMTPEMWVFVIALVLMSWMSSMLGYDKIKEIFEQIAHWNK